MTPDQIKNWSRRVEGRCFAVTLASLVRKRGILDRATVWLVLRVVLCFCFFILLLEEILLCICWTSGYFPLVLLYLRWCKVSTTSDLAQCQCSSLLRNKPYLVPLDVRMGVTSHGMVLCAKSADKKAWKKFLADSRCQPDWHFANVTPRSSPPLNGGPGNQ